MLARKLLALSALLSFVQAPVLADYDVKVELKNLSGQEKTDWPVILRVYTVFGRDLPARSINPQGYHVYDPAGKEVPHAVEVIPPYDQPGNDELIFIVPRMAPGETLSYRVTNTGQKSDLRKDTKDFDLTGGPHNLIANGAFEKSDGDSPAGFTGAGKLDSEVKRSGKTSLRLSADGQTVSAKLTGPIALHKDSWYYFGVWSRTDNVSRFGYQAGDAAHFKVAGFTPPPTTQPSNARYAEIPNQCYTRDWQKVTFEYRGHTSWGMDIYAGKAFTDAGSVEFTLDQRRHYYMEPGKTRGTWWLDDAVLMEQPEVNVRFDLAVQNLAQDAIFLFTRPNCTYMGRRLDENNHNDPQAWCNFPYPHEKLTRLDRFAVKGQRVSCCIGFYHKREIPALLVRLNEGALGGPGGARIPLEVEEYCPGYTGPDADRYLQVLNAPGGVLNAASPAGSDGVRYFFLTFDVPRIAPSGVYSASVDVLLSPKHAKPNSWDRFATIPITLRVQDMVAPEIKDAYVGIIHQSGSSVPASDEMLKVYGRSGFTLITWFGSFVPYKKDLEGRMHVDAEGLDRQMKRLLAVGITGGCGLYTDVQLDDKPKGHQGRMIGFARAEVAAAKAATQAAAGKFGPQLAPVPTEKEAYARLLKELDAAARQHPEWPTIIHMNWDEPPPLNDRMGWTREILPDALVTLDTQFNPLANCAKYYNVPAFDNPANWAGPELYRWVKQAAKDFGYCGQPASAEWSRYQGGMLMITTGARYIHGWHLQNANSQIAPGPTKDSVVRAISMIVWGEAINDLRAHRLLTQAMQDARKSGDGKRASAADEAEKYLKQVLTVWNGDHKSRWPIEPYLGQAADWGYERFYDDWQEQMLKHAAACKGIGWVD